MGNAMMGNPMMGNPIMAQDPMMMGNPYGNMGSMGGMGFLGYLFVGINARMRHTFRAQFVFPRKLMTTIWWHP